MTLPRMFLEFIARTEVKRKQFSMQRNRATQKLSERMVLREITQENKHFNNNLIDANLSFV